MTRDVPLPEAQKHYVEKDDYNAFIYHQRNLDANNRTLQVIHDAERLLDICGGDFDDTSEYQLLIRLLKEQTTFITTGPALREKKEKEDPSKVLLNPSDPEATSVKRLAVNIGDMQRILQKQ